MKSKFISISLGLLVVYLTGCGSIAYRKNSSSSNIAPGIYPGVRYDTEIMKDAFKEHPPEVYSLAGPFMDVISWVMFPFALIDTPFSAVLDTLCLPYDIFQGPKEKGG